MSTFPDDAACHGVETDVFVIDDQRRCNRHPTAAGRAKLANALAICHTCPVVSECRNYVAS